MRNQQLADELADLRSQLETLRQERLAESASPESEMADEAEQEGPDAKVDELEESDLSKQFQELMEQLDQDLKESNPTTLLAVFALGILIGRLLPR